MNMKTDLKRIPFALAFSAHKSAKSMANFRLSMPTLAKSEGPSPNSDLRPILRISGFGFLSDFYLRISDLP